MKDTFTISIYGASGFTGRIAAESLSQVASLRLLIAGRNKEKLEAVANSCKHRPEIFVADAQDRKRLSELVAKSDVILNFAGPFLYYAETLISEVVRQGKRYCDISGETVFYADMQEKYEAEAKRTGATLIPMAGFDSIPADIGAYLCFKTASANKISIDSIEHYYTVKGKFNGGTIATALSMTDDSVRKRFADENILIPDQNWQKVQSLDPKPSYEPYLKTWTGPFFMHATNAAVVRRARYLAEDSAAAKVSYSERMIFGRGAKGMIAAHGGTYGVAGFMNLTKSAFGRKLVAKIAPAPGEGPSAKDQKQGFYKGILLAKSQGSVKLSVKLKMNGDPGNLVTVLCASETAKLLADSPNLPTGFTTASQAFGEALIEKLRSRGASFEIELNESKS